MNKERIKQFPFVFFLIPYIHISLAMDYLFDSIIGIFLFVLVTAIIGFFCEANAAAAFIGDWEYHQYFIKRSIDFAKKPVGESLSLLLTIHGDRSLVRPFFDLTNYRNFLG